MGKKVLHIDMPRALTTTLREIDFRSSIELNTYNVYLQTIDLGIDFWYWLCMKHKFDISNLFIENVSPETISEINSIFNSLGSHYEININSSGIVFNLNNTSQISDCIENKKFYSLIESYVDNFILKFKFSELCFDTVSLGCTSTDSLVFACAFAKALKAKGYEKSIVLGKHTYENFSLSIRKDFINKDDSLYKYFAHIIFQEEKYTESILEILNTDNIKRDRNFDSNSLINRDSLYQKFIPIRKELCTILMPISRNKCYWKKCTFCVQIEHNLEDNYWDKKSELNAAIEEISILKNHGFHYFIFSDQAVSPSQLNKFCSSLEANNLDIRWTVRIIADANFKKELMKRMFKLGCFEVLFGLETANQDTALSMKKVSNKKDITETEAMIAEFENCGISVFLNLIYAFPTEPDEDFIETYNSFKRLKKKIPGMTVQFNKFALFFGTEMYKNPQNYNLDFIEKVDIEKNLKTICDYKDKYNREYDSPPNEQYFYDSIGIKKTELKSIEDAHGFMFLQTLFQLSYASFGVIFKAETSKNYSDIFVENFFSTQS